MKPQTVLSLFNGMGTLRKAFHEMGIPVAKYYSSEIKPYAIKLQRHHFPDVIEVGDINNWREWDIDWKSITFIGSGSPCQDLSIAGKRAGISGSRSNLFFVFVDILNHVKKLNPNVLFLQENVGSANKTDVGIMSRALGVYPCRINSKLVTAQLRDRYYWTNIRTKPHGMFDIISDIPQPKDRKIAFKDIITDGVVEREKAVAILESESRVCSSQESIKNRAKKDFINIVYTDTNEVRVKTNTKKGYDVATENDCIDLSFPTSKTRRGRVTKGKSPCLLRQNNLNVVIQVNASKESGGKQPFQQNRIYDIEGKYPALCTTNNGKITDKYFVRTINKIEMCRLQGFPDNFCDSISKTHAASLLGDGWTLPIIIHILSFTEGVS